jgi:hypothetical protein
VAPSPRPGVLARRAGFLIAVAVAVPILSGALLVLRATLSAAASEVYVAVVVDFGGGSAPAAITKCVAVPSSDTDADALAAAVGSDNVAYNDTGLVCAIDGYPVNGVQDCTATSGSEYYYWSYWHGSSGSWSYANDGPGGQTVAAGDVEGWRYEDPGPASPAADSPSPTPDYARICPQAVAATTTTTTKGSGKGPSPTTTTTTHPSSTHAPTPSTTTSTTHAVATTTTSSTAKDTPPPAKPGSKTSARHTKSAAPQHHKAKHASATPATHHSGAGVAFPTALLVTSGVILLLVVLTFWRRGQSESP